MFRSQVPCQRYCLGTLVPQTRTWSRPQQARHRHPRACFCMRTHTSHAAKSTHPCPLQPSLQAGDQNQRPAAHTASNARTAATQKKEFENDGISAKTVPLAIFLEWQHQGKNEKAHARSGRRFAATFAAGGSWNTCLQEQNSRLKPCP